MNQKALKEIHSMIDMLLEFSNDISIQRRKDKIAIFCKLVEVRTGQPYVLYCTTDDRSLFELDYGIWEGYKASVDFPFDLETVKENITGTNYHYRVITENSTVCWRFPTYLSISDLRIYLEKEME